MTAGGGGQRPGPFIVTKAHRRCTAWADALRTHRTIGVCFGPAGVGKTRSARRHAHWALAEPLRHTWGPREPSDAHVSAALARSRTVCSPPTGGGTLRALRQDRHLMTSRVESCIEQHHGRHSDGQRGVARDSRIERIIIDEAERLTTSALEHRRDLFERTPLGWMRMGMPGIETRLARSPQLYSRVGFAPHYRPRQDDELTFVLTRQWRQLGLSLDSTAFTDTQAMAAISRITRGNFRLLHRVFVQMERILRLNALHVITEDVVAAARSTLVIGATER
jgi:DNA transposition AAA+ family ATPase